ncbi:hypothetical protein IAU59_001203 [Kwoniella sp. CBS 9459]
MDGVMMPDKANSWDAGVGIWKLTGKKTKVVKELDKLFDLLKKGESTPMALRATKGGALVEHRYYAVVSTSSFPYNEKTLYYVTLYDPIDSVEKRGKWTTSRRELTMWRWSRKMPRRWTSALAFVLFLSSPHLTPLL